MTPIMAVLLVFTITNTWTGEELYKRELVIDYTKDKIEECRLQGLRWKDEKLVEYEGKHASANISCRWIQLPGQPA